MQQKEKNRRQKKSKSLLNRIAHPMLFLVILDTILFAALFWQLDIVNVLNGNNREIMQKQVTNRRGYLQSQMTEKWMKLNELAEYINTQTEEMLAANEISMDELDTKASACAPLVLRVVDRMISEMYNKQVSGIFLTFSTHDLDADIAAGTYREKTGIYIRDNDPLSTASIRNADLLLECAPVPVVQQLNLSTDSNWEQKFKFSTERPYENWLTDPIRVAGSGSEYLEGTDYGLWCMRKDSAGNTALAYSMPLILQDGTVYGVLGIEMLQSYLHSLMPYSELNDKGIYMLVRKDTPDTGEDRKLTVCSVTQKTQVFGINEQICFEVDQTDGFIVRTPDREYVASLVPLSLYSRNAPFENQNWYVAGLVPKTELYAFSNRVVMLFGILVLLMIAVGLMTVGIASWRIARPVNALKKELESTEQEHIPVLSATGISEVDEFAEAITDLSRDVIHSSRRFLSIMEMSSVDMGGYELDMVNREVFITENFFRVLGMDQVKNSKVTYDEFKEYIRQFNEHATMEQMENGGYLFSTLDRNGNRRYIHVEETELEGRRVGLIEDATMETLEKKHIEHERDYDLLTGIYNRRAFYRDATEVMTDREKQGMAVVVMLDLDNLKSFNDTYGHEWGDRYIVACAKCLQKGTSENSVIARLSGDEFILLLYGFENETARDEAVRCVKRAFTEYRFELPDDRICPIEASAGIAYAGVHSDDLHTLIRYADFAMYQVKHSQKGHFAVFDPEQYQMSETMERKQNALRQVIADERVHYYFQPIIDARTGNVFGYEALMRVNDPEFRGIDDFLRTAKLDNAQYAIEKLTWFHALESFENLLKNGLIAPGTRIFINSQINYLLEEEDLQKLIERFSDLRKYTIMEVLETDDYSGSIAALRSSRQKLFTSNIALDDFGTGYNSEKNLLELMPDLIKLDISLVRDVEKKKERQQLISGMITFAHTQNMLVLAEGVETMSEMNCLMSLGVDMFQGYLFARPAAKPEELNSEAIAMIHLFQNGRNTKVSV